MASLLDFLTGGGQPGGLLGNMQPQPTQQPPQTTDQGGGFGSGFGSYIANNPLTLMALGGGIARHGVGGFADAAPVALQEQDKNLKQQIMAATYQAALKAGKNPSEAMLLANNPQALSTLETIRHQHATEQQAATAPIKIGQDAFGGDIYAVRDPSVLGGYRKIQASGATGGEASAPAATGLTGEDYLKTAPTEKQSLIRGLANYDVNPNSLSIKGGHRERTLAEVLQFRPDYDQKNYAASQEGLKKFQSGQQGNSIRSFNTALEHLDQLDTLGAALKNGDIQKVNEIKNWWQKNVGSEAPTNFTGLRNIVGQEVVKAIVANGGGEREREEAAKSISAASSPEQLAGIISTYKSAMGAQLQGLKLQYEQSTLRSDFHRLLSEKGKAALEKHQAGPTQAAPASVAPALPAAPAQPSPEAIKALRGNPNLIEQFDAKYGQGAAKRVLGMQQM